MKAFCLIKQNKVLEAQDLLVEVKQAKPSDTITAKYLIEAFNDLGQYSDTTGILEYVLELSTENEELGEELFFSYVRENKLLKT